MLPCISSKPSIPSQTVVTDHIFLSQRTLNGLDCAIAANRGLANAMQGRTAHQKRVYGNTVLGHAGTRCHLAPRSLHSQKSVSGRLLPTTSKSSSIDDSTSLLRSNMFIVHFKRVSAQKQVGEWAPCRASRTARGLFHLRST